MFWEIKMGCFCLTIHIKVLCVHGGLSPDIRTIDQILVIECNCEIPHEWPFCDLVWSDPEDIETWAVSPRGAGWLFRSRVTTEVWSALNYCNPCGNVASIFNTELQ